MRSLQTVLASTSTIPVSLKPALAANTGQVIIVGVSLAGLVAAYETGSSFNTWAVKRFRQNLMIPDE